MMACVAAGSVALVGKVDAEAFVGEERGGDAIGNAVEFAVGGVAVEIVVERMKEMSLQVFEPFRHFD